MLAAGCSGNAAHKAAPTVTVTASAPAQPLSKEDQFSAQLACFALQTYRKGKEAGDPNTLRYATTAQEPAGRMADPRWSRVAELPPAEAMKTLGDLCAEIHYHEP